jgi:hypothetical protein
MNYAVEMGSGAMIYIPSFIEIGSGIQKLIGGDSQTHRQHGDRISLLSFVENIKNRLKHLIILKSLSVKYQRILPLSCTAAV